MSPPKIITFYSYKGGTGRTMALANVAWILAATGKNVLVIDWDLEAPGLHRYLHPFLNDKELTSTEGLIDFVVQYADRAATKAKRAKGNWYEPYANILHYASSLNHPFKKGTIDFVPAGRQGAEYAARVNSFNWQHFYERLDGGLFFEAAKESMAGYDYVLIDSRTGVSDTSGICTVQMPDMLVVCFTLNIQSIEGAAAVAESASAQRRDERGRPTLKIFPVPTRVELTEQKKLKAAREVARERFKPLLNHVAKKQDQYWEGVEVLYQPFYAYEEVLAVFGDAPGKANSMLSSMETLAGHLVGKRGPLRMPASTQSQRDAMLARYARQPKESFENLVRRLQGHTASVRAVSLSPDNKLAVSGSEDKTVRLWDIATGECLRTFEGHTDAVQSVAFAPDGKTCVSGGSDKRIVIWNLGRGKKRKRELSHVDAIHSIAVSADGKSILGGSSDAGIIRWDLLTGKVRILQGHADAVAAVRFSADERFAASGGYDKMIILWDLSKGLPLRTFTGHTREINSLCFSQDGKRLVSGSSDQTLMLWDVENAAAIRKMTGHDGKVYSVDITPDGRYALSGSADKTMILWNLETGEIVKTFQGHSNLVNSVKFASDSRSAISASDDGSLIIWDLSTAIGARQQVPVTPPPPEVSKTTLTKREPSPIVERQPDAPWFYFSVAAIDRDKYFERFFADLSREMLALHGQSVPMFYDAVVGDNWSDRIQHALRTCKVAVCMLTPSYFASAFCGKEFEIFRQRAGDSTVGIGPISWIRADMPPVMSRFNVFDKSQPAVYGQLGLSFLMRLSRYKTDYELLVKRFASDLLDVAQYTPLPELPTMPNFDAVRSAFAEPQTLGPSAFVQDFFRKYRPTESLFGDMPTKGESAEVWFFSSDESLFGTRLTSIGMDVAQKLTLNFRSFESSPKGVVEELKKAATTNAILVITAGPRFEAFLGTLIKQIEELDQTRCALLIVNSEQRPALPPLPPHLGYLATDLETETSYRIALETAIVKIRHATISRGAPVMFNAGGSSNTPILPTPA